MSDSIPDNPKKRPSKNLPSPKPDKQMAQYSNEADLWNLDDDSADIPLAARRPPATSKLPMLRMIDDPKSVSSKPQGRSAPTDRKTPAADDLAATGAKEPQIPASPKKPPLTQTENDIWDNFLDDEPPRPIHRGVENQITSRDTKLEEILQQPLHAEQSVRDIIRPVIDSPPALETPVKDAQDTPPQTVDVAPEKIARGLQITKFTRLEAVTSLVFLSLLLIGAVAAYSSFRSHLKAQIDPYATPDFPVKGNIATVANAETYWRAPIKDGPNPDPTKLDVILLPVISITLNDCKAKQGALRILFLNENDDIVGDAITKSYSNNQFDANKSATMTFPSTAGFIDFGEQEAYRAKVSKPWSVRVLEGPAETADSNSFKLLFKTPIAIERH